VENATWGGAPVLGEGRIIVNTGDGKGKTTAAFGTVFRAAGHGQRIAVVQFIKGEWNYGEARAAEKFSNIEITRIGAGFTWLAKDLEESRNLAREAWAKCLELGTSEALDLLVMDELNCAVAEGFVGVEEVVQFLRQKRPRLSVIITGRDARAEIIDVADTVTEMRCIKHAFAQGVPGRRGIEY
jgi:cob(I)alamin adenosyltransferase